MYRLHQASNLYPEGSHVQPIAEAPHAEDHVEGMPVTEKIVAKIQFARRADQLENKSEPTDQAHMSAKDNAANDIVLGKEQRPSTVYRTRCDEAGEEPLRLLVGKSRPERTARSGDRKLGIQAGTTEGRKRTDAPQYFLAGASHAEDHLENCLAEGTAAGEDSAQATEFKHDIPHQMIQVDNKSGLEGTEGPSKETPGVDTHGEPKSGNVERFCQPKDIPEVHDATYNDPYPEDSDTRVMIPVETSITGSTTGALAESQSSLVNRGRALTITDGDNVSVTGTDRTRGFSPTEDEKLAIRAGMAGRRKLLPTSMLLKVTIVSFGVLGSLQSVVKERSAAAGYVMSAFNITSAVMSAILVFVKWRAGHKAYKSSAEQERRDLVERIA